MNHSIIQQHVQISYFEMKLFVASLFSRISFFTPATHFQIRFYICFFFQLYKSLFVAKINPETRSAFSAAVSRLLSALYQFSAAHVTNSTPVVAAHVDMGPGNVISSESSSQSHDTHPLAF